MAIPIELIGGIGDFLSLRQQTDFMETRAAHKATCVSAGCSLRNGHDEPCNGPERVTVCPKCNVEFCTRAPWQRVPRPYCGVCRDAAENAVQKTDFRFPIPEGALYGFMLERACVAEVVVGPVSYLKMVVDAGWRNDVTVDGKPLVLMGGEALLRCSSNPGKVTWHTVPNARQEQKATAPKLAAWREGCARELRDLRERKHALKAEADSLVRDCAAFRAACRPMWDKAPKVTPEDIYAHVGDPCWCPKCDGDRAGRACRVKRAQEAGLAYLTRIGARVSPAFDITVNGKFVPVDDPAAMCGVEKCPKGCTHDCWTRDCSCLIARTKRFLAEKDAGGGVASSIDAYNGTKRAVTLRGLAGAVEHFRAAFVILAFGCACAWGGDALPARLCVLAAGWSFGWNVSAAFRAVKRG